MTIDKMKGLALLVLVFYLCMSLTTAGVPVNDVMDDFAGFDVSAQDIPDFLSCTVCKLLVESVEKLALKTIAAIEAAMKRVCNTLPRGMENKCNSIVDNYSTVLANLILKNLPAYRICTFLKLCMIEDQIETSVELPLIEMEYGKKVKYCEYKGLTYLPRSKFTDYEDCTTCVCTRIGLLCYGLIENFDYSKNSPCVDVTVGCKTRWVLRGNKNKMCPKNKLEDMGVSTVPLK